MIDPNRVTEAVMEFMQNPTWKEIFTNAPGGAMERLAISFYFSKFHDEFQAEDFQEYRDLRDEYEKSMTEEDLNYLVENTDKPAAKKHYQDLLDRLHKNGGEVKGTLRFEKEGEGEQEGNGEAQPEGTEGQGEQAAVQEEEKPVEQGEQPPPQEGEGQKKPEDEQA